MKIVGMDIHRSFAQVAIPADSTVIKQLRVELVTSFKTNSLCPSNFFNQTDPNLASQI
jgi:hypothetical protein